MVVMWIHVRHVWHRASLEVAMTVVLLIVIVSIMFIKAAKRIRHRTSLARASNRGCRYMLYYPIIAGKRPR
jgi:hypothetical protein